MPVINMMIGAPSPSGATFSVKVENGPIRIAVSDSPSMSGPVFTSSESVDGQGVAKATITGLDPLTRYYWQVEDDSVIDDSVTGTFRTHPPIGSIASFKFGGSSCAGSGTSFSGEGDVLASSRVSNHPVFSHLAKKAIEENWAFLWHGGDITYYDLGSGNHGIEGGASLANYRRMFDDVLLQPRQAKLYRSVPVVYTQDDHGFGPNNSDRTHTGRDNFLEAYREKIPHHPLADPTINAGTYHSFDVGRVLFIAADVRSDRDPNSDTDTSSKTMLGSAQKAWMEQVLTSSRAKLFCWLNPEAFWHIPTAETDSWGQFTFERDELVEMFGDLGWLKRMFILNGDRHHVGINSGRHPYGRMPVYQCSPLDSGPITPPPGLWDIGSGAIRGSYGNFEIRDNGNQLIVNGSVRSMS